MRIVGVVVLLDSRLFFRCVYRCSCFNFFFVIFFSHLSVFLKSFTLLSRKKISLPPYLVLLLAFLNSHLHTSPFPPSHPTPLIPSSSKLERPSKISIESPMSDMRNRRKV